MTNNKNKTRTIWQNGHVRVVRYFAPSGNTDADYFSPRCDVCGWSGAFHSNRTIEGRRIAERQATDHRCLA